MSARSTRKTSFSELEALPPDLRDLTHSCHPRLLAGKGAAVNPPLNWSGPGGSAQGASLQSLIVAPKERC
jgi:hypothetical protein